MLNCYKCPTLFCLRVKHIQQRQTLKIRRKQNNKVSITSFPNALDIPSSSFCSPELRSAAKIFLNHYSSSNHLPPVYIRQNIMKRDKTFNEQAIDTSCSQVFNINLVTS